jgi:hypothetical protein
MRRLIQLATLFTLFTLALMVGTAFGSTTWYIRAGGGTRYDSVNNTSGQCSGKVDADYPGTGTNQACGFNDWRYLYDLANGTVPLAWVIAGGDTVVIRGCHALATQTNPSNPNCRTGWDENNGSPGDNFFCYAYGNTGCYAPPIPAGTSGAHTKILGGCAYGTYTCTPISGTYPYGGGTTNETQLFGGFGLAYTLNLQNTQYVDVEGLEITSHNQTEASSYTAYSDATTYSIGQGVSSAGAVYVSLQNSNLSNTPSTSPTWWQLAPNCTRHGSPANEIGCSTSPPDDYAGSGILTNNQTANVNLTDVYVHGFADQGIFGPIGAPIINMTRTFVGFNGFAGWNFDDANTYNGAISAYSITSNVITLTYTGSTVDAGMLIVLNGFGTSTFLNGQVITLTSTTSTQMVGNFTHANASATESGTWANNSTPNATGASINAQYVTMNWNGCYEQYPHVDAIPARKCYDDLAGGFGDSWSGQQSTLSSFICNFCVDNYNTKDCFIGPHTFITTLVITNSESIGCMGQSWKWGGSPLAQSLTFLNNMTVSGNWRMSAAIAGTPSGYNQYLSDFGRASGNVVASTIPLGSSWIIGNNTWITNASTTFDIACPGYSPCTSTVVVNNNIFLGYQNIPTPSGIPAIFYIEDASITVNCANNIYYGVRNTTCNSSSGIITSDPLMVNEPSQASTAQSTLDLFNPAVGGNSLEPASGSPAVGGGVTYTGLLPYDYFRTATTTPPVIGASNYGAPTSPQVVMSGNVTMGGTQK